MQPIACALDILQCEQNMYVGYLLPTLVSLEFKLKLLKPTLKYASPLADAVLAGIAKRFTASGFFDRSDLILASITLPQFKLRWLDDSRKEQARSFLDSFARTMQQQQLSHNDSGSDDGHISQEDEFFCFGNSQANDRQKIVDTEVDMYLSDSCKEIARLKIFPCIMKLYLKYNTTLPSIAPVERLFSLGSLGVID
jgi:hypothetical protein